MTTSKDELINLAKKITPPGEQCGNSIQSIASSLATELNSYMDNREDLQELIGKNNRELMYSNHENHVNYMISLAYLYDPKTFIETLIWVFRTYINHGFSEKYWSAMLPVSKNIFRSNLNDNDYTEIEVIFNYIQDNLTDLIATSKVTNSFYENLGKSGGIVNEK